VEDRHSPYDRIGEIHDHVNGAAVGNNDRVQPQRVGNGLVVFSVRYVVPQCGAVRVHPCRMWFDCEPSWIAAK